MADTTIQREVAAWVRSEFLPKEFGGRYAQGPVKLNSGGQHRFAIVSEDSGMVGSICTSAARTASGKLGVGKLTKIRADMFFLLLTTATRRIVAFLDNGMCELMEKERNEGRVPPEIEFVLVKGLPPALRNRLTMSQKTASYEVTPG